MILRFASAIGSIVVIAGLFLLVAVLVIVELFTDNFEGSRDGEP